MKKKIIIIAVIAIVCAVAAWLFLAGPLASPKSDATDEEEEMEKLNPVGPAFNADSAYAFTKAQCDFGTREMNSTGHQRCLEWIVAKFRSYGCQVEEQKADLTGWDGTTLHATNIIARWNPQAKRRVMLCAHWDSRPWADNDPDSANWHKPILAANDAASGVAVMLEVARLLSLSPASSKGGGEATAPSSTGQDNNATGGPGEAVNGELGIDFVCFDAEDWGTPQWSSQPDDGSSWALGAQYWAEHAKESVKPEWGILLDMVGGQGARFYREAMSMQYASDLVKRVWRAARQAGYGSSFPRQDGGMITDDHIPVNQVAQIPCIDIIPYYPDCQQSSFGPTWHTLADDLDHIDPNTLKAVGQTLVQVIWTEFQAPE